MCRHIKRQRQEKEHTRVAFCAGSGLRRCLLRGVVWQSSLLAPTLDLTIATTSRAVSQTAHEAMGGKGQERVQDWDCLWEAVLCFTSVSTLGWRLKSSAGYQNLSLEVLETGKILCAWFCVVGSLKKTKNWEFNSNIRPTTWYCLSTLVVW